MTYIKYILLIIVLMQLSYVVYKADLMVDEYLTDDVIFQNKIKLGINKIKEDNNEQSLTKTISLLEVSQMRDVEHFLIFKLLDYLYYFFITSVLLTLVCIHNVKREKSRGQTT